MNHGGGVVTDPSTSDRSTLRIGRVLGALTPPVRLFMALAFGVFALDQWTKWLAISHLTDAFEAAGASSFGERFSSFLWSTHPARSGSVEVVANFWHFRYVENDGAAFGFLAGSDSALRTPFFIVVSIAAMIFIVTYFRKTGPGQILLRVALALVFGGAIGNLTDRVRLGYVIDFIDWHWYESARWPTFNVADAGISVGVSLLLLEVFISPPPTAEKQGPKSISQKSKAKAKEGI